MEPEVILGPGRKLLSRLQRPLRLVQLKIGFRQLEKHIGAGGLNRQEASDGSGGLTAGQIDGGQVVAGIPISGVEAQADAELLASLIQLTLKKVAVPQVVMSQHGLRFNFKSRLEGRHGICGLALLVKNNSQQVQTGHAARIALQALLNLFQGLGDLPLVQQFVGGRKV